MILKKFNELFAAKNGTQSQSAEPIVVSIDVLSILGPTFLSIIQMSLLKMDRI